MTGCLITNARILDGTGREPFAGAVRVEGSRIAEVATARRARPREGALADLLLVDGDPLADIAILQDHAALRAIMKDGALHKAP